MPRIDSLQSLLVNELRDLLDAERRLTKAIPKMAKNASSEPLREALTQHLEETEEQLTRLEEALTALDVDPRAKTCHGMMGLIEEGSEHMQEDYEDDALRDAAIIGAAQKVEHYEIAGYGTAATYARMLGNDHVASLLETTLEEEKAADKKLTEIAESAVNQDAAQEGEGGEMGDQEGAMAGRARTGGMARPGARAVSGMGARSGRSSGAMKRK
jgi:ferritin-like metal-binding protein YciE